MSENLIELSAFAGRPETDQSGRASSVNYREKVRCIRQYITMAHGSPGKQPKTVALYVRHHCRRRRHSSHRISPPIRLSSSGAQRPDSEVPSSAESRPSRRRQVPHADATPHHTIRINFASASRWHDSDQANASLESTEKQCLPSSCE